jgi:hypothetical protein
MKKASDLNARITFNCGVESAPIYIDNVSLKLYDSTTASVQYYNQQFTNGEHLTFRNIDQRVQFQLTVINPEKARLEVFDLQGKVRGSLTNQIRSSGKGKCSLMMNNRLASGFYLIRYFDGQKLFLHSWSNVVKR